MYFQVHVHNSTQTIPYCMHLPVSLYTYVLSAEQNFHFMWKHEINLITNSFLRKESIESIALSR